MSQLPPILHMMYFPWDRNQKLLPDPDAFDHRPYENMKRYAPDFEVRLWTWPRVREFCEPNYPAIWALLPTLARPTMMVDVLRWLVVYHFGGLYWQYDMNPLAPMTRMLPGPGREVRLFTEFVNDEAFCRRMAAEPIRRGEPEEPVRVANQAFSAIPRHRFIRAALDLIVERASTLQPRRDYDILYICANAAVSTAYDRFGKNDPGVELMSLADTRRLMKFRFKGSWRVESAPTRGIQAAAGRSSALRRRARAMIAGAPGLRTVYYGFRGHPWERAFETVPGVEEWSAGLQAAWPELKQAFGLRSVLEYPCGAMTAAKEAALAGLAYAGAHPDRARVRQLRARQPAVRFQFANPMLGAWPRADVATLRGFFERLAFGEIGRTLHAILRSGTPYLLAHTHPLLNSNWDTALGDARPLNFGLAPFDWPEPAWSGPDPDPLGRPDRILALWRVRDLPIPPPMA